MLELDFYKVNCDNLYISEKSFHFDYELFWKKLVGQSTP